MKISAALARKLVGGKAGLTLADHARLAGLPVPVAEFRFHPTRRWRFDWAWPSLRIALEIEGGVWTRGRHTRPAGYLADMTKYNAAAILGWRVLRASTAMVNSGEALTLIREALA